MRKQAVTFTVEQGAAFYLDSLLCLPYDQTDAIAAVIDFIVIKTVALFHH